MQRQVSLDIGRRFAEARSKRAGTGRHRQIAALSGGDGNDGVALFTSHSWEPSDRVRVLFLHAAATILSATSEHALNFNWSGGAQAKSFFVDRKE